MAYLEQRRCLTHGDTNFINGTCSKCTSDAAKRKRDRAKAWWDKLSIEEKLDYLFFKDMG